MNTATECCSRLSVHFAWGTMSLREAFQTLEKRIAELDKKDTKDSGKWKRSLSMFKSRLYWHDHFIQRLEDEPEIEFKPINRAFSEDKIPYIRDLEVFDRWYHGYTGSPMVDACMRCFHTTGYLNFRMRAMITSFACNILALPWRDIMYPMAGLMADYIPGIHIAQLQMQAGITGINSIRVYKPKKQIKDQDPDCKFIKKWIPELRDYTASEILSYDEGGLLDLEGYPNPIIEYDGRRSEMLSALYEIKKSDAGQKEADRVLEQHGSRKNS
jgi:deoxyribodipyrimidine photo-lyase